MESGFENGVRLQAIRKAAHKASHRGMPQAIEAEGEHFVESLVGGPVFKGNAIGCDEHTGTILAKFAMDKNCLRGSGAKERNEFGELLG